MFNLDKGKIIKLVFLLIFSFFVLGFLGLTFLVAWTAKDLPDPDKLTERQIAQSTKIYDRTGEHLLYEIYSQEKRTLVDLDQIPKNLINGLIATEDSEFYHHHGIRVKSILRSVFLGLIGRQRIGSGASTITQQLVKNAILTNERTLSRKLKEVILSLRIEQKFNKNQILKIYFNEIPYGSTNYGVEAAAQSYFNKHVSELNLAECATLAGMPKAPSKYLNNHEDLLQRRNFVLERMFEEGYISQTEKNEAQAQPLNLNIHYADIKAPHFVLYIKEKLVEQFGEPVVETGGLKVITSLDWQKQQIAEEAVEDYAEDILNEAGANNASLLAVDPKTGQILAMVGSHNFYDKDIHGQFNVAVLGRRQPGSSFKPIIYAAAFEKGYTPETILFDVLTNFAVSGRPYIPRNYDLKERGPINMRKALQGSLNIPAVKTLYLVGLKQGVKFAERLGYTTLSNGDFGLSLVLGGGEVKLIDHVYAYSVFANGGTLLKPVSILRVEDSSGKTIYEWTRPESAKEVLDIKIANLMSDVLSDDDARAYAFGAHGVLTLPDRPVAAKTGTTNNYVDAWTIGYTPSLVAGVWAGNTDNKPMKRGYGGSRVAAPIWNYFMKKSLEGQPVEGFPAPPKNTAKKPILNGSLNGSVTLKIDKLTGNLATSSTPKKYIEERTYIPPHCILHYVKKDDPRGEPPENPEEDPQYLIWEKAIQDWIKRKKEEDPDWKVSFEEPPTEYDDIHSLELIPNLEIVYPQDGEIVNTPKLETDIRVSAERGIKKVMYQIDGRYVGVVKSHPFNLSKDLINLEQGEHTLTVSAYDDVDNRAIKEVKFIYKAKKITDVKMAINIKSNLKVNKNQEFKLPLVCQNLSIGQVIFIKIKHQQDVKDRNVFNYIIDDSVSDLNNIYIDLPKFNNIGDYKISVGVVVDGQEYEITSRVVRVVE